MSMKRKLGQTIQFCVQGRRESFEIVPGQALYFDAILESNQDTVFAVGECKHKDCVRVPGLEDGPFFWSFESYLRGKACFVHDLFPLDKLIEQCDYFGVPLQTVVASVDRALDDFAPCDFALAHSKKYDHLLAPLFEESGFPNWPTCLPRDAVVMGSALTYHVGCLPFYSNKLTIHVRDADDVPAVSECLPEVEVVHTTETVPSLLMRCVRRSGQMAWIPDKQQVVATLECWRVLITSHQEDESESVLWPCTPPSSLDLQQTVVLMTPLVQFDHGMLRFEGSWSEKHELFENLVSRVYQVHDVRKPVIFECDGCISEIVWMSVFWGRFEIQADYDQDQECLTWRINAYHKHKPSPLVSYRF